ncbi:MAG: hypothetical protein EA399_09760 [Desulfovibrionales bacterium]|nr:MAG: hypothetical protein EA399_09760 [Desulfovibrionales bacterium]
MRTSLNITNPKTVYGLLQVTRDRRTNVIIVPAGHGRYRSVIGSLRDVATRGVTVEVPGLNAASTTWIGRMVVCYFRVRDPARNADIFYNFTSPILDVALSRTGSSLTLELPATMDIGQRRSNIRLDPASGDILNFSLWEESALFARCTQAGRTRLCSPVITGQHFAKGVVSVQDVSAGGIKVRLRKRLFTASQTESDPGVHQRAGTGEEILSPGGNVSGPLAWGRGVKLVIWLVLAEHAGNTHRVFWLRGRIRYKREDYQTKDLDFGVELSHFGKNDQQGKFTWSAVQENEIQELGAWVYHRYLERFRRGIA